MWNAFLWGLLATSSLVLGGLIASSFTFGKRTLGVIMAFVAGTLISAISQESIFEPVKIAPLSGFPAMGLFAGAFTFFSSDKLIEKLGAKSHMEIGTSYASRLIIPMVLASSWTACPNPL